MSLILVNLGSLMLFSTYSLRKSRLILSHTYALYKNKWQSISEEHLAILENVMENLEKAINDKNKEQANALAKQLEDLSKIHLRKSIYDHLKELGIALILAFILAVIIRQTCFEHMEIPTGSLRPTFKEKDCLIVFKTSFGLNIPLIPEHFYFDQDLVQRTGIFIFRPENMDMENTDTTYFGIPGKKRYIKRCMGKPGDTLYFYGGTLYGFDEDGNDITEFHNNPSLSGLEHIPFIKLYGKTRVKLSNSSRLPAKEFLLHQMNTPIGKVLQQPNGSIEGKVYINGHWEEETPSFNYFDFFGLKNYAMARLLTKEEALTYSEAPFEDIEDAPLYLELRHHPKVSHHNPPNDNNRYFNPVDIETSLIPLREEHLKAIMDNMYTARFRIHGGKAKRYDLSFSPPGSSPIYPRFNKINDGLYEFYYGKAYQVSYSGYVEELPSNHPLYSLKYEHIHKLFNLGIEFQNYFSPKNTEYPVFPSRYAYFRNGDLYLLGAPIIKKDDPALIDFHAKEQRRANASKRHLYFPFRDYGPPIHDDGSLDKDFITKYGIKIPAGHYLALGDNHAMSLDSRDFGFVPQGNLRGGAGPIIWPFGERWGAPAQPGYPWINVPNIILAIIITLSLSLAIFIGYRNKNKKIYFKLGPTPKTGE